MAKATDGHTQFGINYLLAQEDGYYTAMDHFQAGKLYITGANEKTASGVFETEWTDADDPAFVGITLRAHPSGYWYMSSKSTTGFVVTFTSAPAGPAETFPYHIADWFACM